ncbi:aminoglycoside 2'-N-acetyltransferase [Streptomyces mashuensis]|uniref:Aminoglycoside 2'-N-acetyltransferase n=1 Tax=Streptomyces mashuensis TaxID=33904 RepID=A0A919E8T0_9ACTN|nr:GNAT family N-acetyltransferase [Streptomyces mashuensis]GHF24401.1 aminoglycoside 2'-N-acetyltransferase [Streptomyces mashuensis]
MTDLRLAHTSALSPAELAALRALLDDAFDGEFTDEDWDHTIGGLHALVLDGTELIAHGSLVQRRLLHGGHPLRTGYVEGVAVRADRRRAGHGSAVMAALEGALRRGGYQLGALGAADEAVPLYEGRGWRLWRGPSGVLAPTGIERTPDEDGFLYVFPLHGTPLDLDGELVCDWRPGDVW